MLVNCPQCHFSREITLSQVPKNAVVATCPKCQTRFRFREATHDTSSNHQEDIHLSKNEPYTDQYNQQQTIHKETMFNETVHSNTDITKDENKNTHVDTTTNKDKTTYTVKNIAPDEQKQEIDFSLIPWEHPEKFDFFSSFYQTVIRVMFHAPRFFSTIADANSSLLRPLFFYILLRLFQMLMDGMWFMISFRAIEPSITESSVHVLLNTLVQEMTLPLTLLITPITFSIQLYIYTFFFYIMVRLVQPEQTKFTTIFRVIAYSIAPTIVCIIPIAGSLLGSIWFSISCFIGCKYALKLSWGKTTLALAPLYLISIAIGIQGARQFMHFAG